MERDIKGRRETRTKGTLSVETGNIIILTAFITREAGDVGSIQNEEHRTMLCQMPKKSHYYNRGDVNAPFSEGYSFASGLWGHGA